MPAYFDYLSGTPLDPRVLEAMQPYFLKHYANPISQHKPGREAAAVLQECREKVAAFINASPEEIIFTSGGLEANNLAIKGQLMVHENGQLLAAAVEPMSILQSGQYLERWGFSTSLIPVNGNGQIILSGVEKLINKYTRLVSVAWVVAETGLVQPIEAVADIVKAAGVPFHCDAMFAAPFFKIDVKALNVDSLTLCVDFLGGPPAIGALYLREGLRLQPQIQGGMQESGRRSGRENLPGIVGFAKAVEISMTERQDRFNKLKRLDSLLKGYLKEITGLIIHADLPSRVPGNLSCRLDGIESEAVLLALDRAGYYATSGSPCATLAHIPSPTLKAMGLTDEQTAATLNFSLNWNTTETEIHELMKALKPIMERLKAMSF